MNTFFILASLMVIVVLYQIFGPVGYCCKCDKKIWRLNRKKWSPDQVLVWHEKCN